MRGTVFEGGSIQLSATLQSADYYSALGQTLRHVFCHKLKRTSEQAGAVEGTCCNSLPSTGTPHSNETAISSLCSCLLCQLALGRLGRAGCPLRTKIWGSRLHPDWHSEWGSLLATSSSSSMSEQTAGVLQSVSSSWCDGANASPSIFLPLPNKAKSLCNKFQSWSHHTWLMQPSTCVARVNGHAAVSQEWMAMLLTLILRQPLYIPGGSLHTEPGGDKITSCFIGAGALLVGWNLHKELA